MALTITLEKTDRWGKSRVATYKVVDDNGNGGSLDVSEMFNHIENVVVTCITTSLAVTAKWTEYSEDITIGSESSSGDTYMVTVWGT